MAALPDTLPQLQPSADEMALARVSRQRLSRYHDGTRPLSVRVMDTDQEDTLELPGGAVALLVDILEAMAEGRGVSVIPHSGELTTVQAAEILNVSRPYFIKLLADGKIPYRKVGKHRRVRVEDVRAYKARVDRDREAILDQLAAEAQAKGMGYPH